MITPAPALPGAGTTAAGNATILESLQGAGLAVTSVLPQPATPVPAAPVVSAADNLPLPAGRGNSRPGR